jgi:uncharacterized membrane protein
MFSQLAQGLLFYLIFSLFSLIGLTFTIRIFKGLNVKSYLLSKPVGLVIFAWGLWILSSAKLVRFNNYGLVLGLFILSCLVSIFFIYQYFKYSPQKITKNLIIKILIIEISFLLIYLVYLYVRGFNGALESTEKPMDILMLSSAGKTDFFPFFDPWQALKSVNYYYYGFYLYALLCNLGHIPYTIGYNFSLGLICASTTIFTVIFTYSLTKSKLFSILGAGFVSFAGNLHYTSCLINHFESTETILNEAGKAISPWSNISSTCFYPRATRIYDTSFTINEMPSYSYLLGDLHPHVMSLPFFIMNLFFLHWFYKSKERVNIFFIITFSISMGTSALINTWDFMTLGFILGLIVLRKVYLKFKESKFKKDIIDLLLKTKVAIGSSILILAGPLLFLPFFLKFHSPVTGLGFAPTFVKINDINGKSQYPSGFEFLFKFWGVYILIFLLGVFILKISKVKRKLDFITIIFITSISLIIFTELFYFKDLFHVTNPPYFRANTVFKFTYHAWILMSISFAVMLSYIFKFLVKIPEKIMKYVCISIIGLIVFAYSVAVFIYPIIAIGQAYNPYIPLPTHKSLSLNIFEITDDTITHEQLEKRFNLDGLNAMKNKNIHDFNVINWINKNQKERVVIVEAVGSSYTEFGRISTYTGMGNIVNWPSHEWTWRFHYPYKINSLSEYYERKKIIDESRKQGKDLTPTIECADRDKTELLEFDMDTGYRNADCLSKDVKTIYESTDITKIRDLINQYNVKYIYVGDLERSSYKVNDQKFDDFAIPVMISGDSKLYKIKD